MGRLREFLRTNPKTSFLILLAALVAFYIVAFRVLETDRKRIASVIWETKESLENDDADGAMRWVASDFQHENMDREGLRTFISDGLRDFGPPEIAILKRVITVDGDQATCMLKAMVGFPKLVDVPRSKAITRWRVSLRKADRTWYITEVAPLQVEGRDIGSLEELRRGYRPGRIVP